MPKRFPNPALPGLLVLAAACAASAHVHGGDDDVVRTARAALRAEATSSDLDTALTSLDGVAARHRGDAAFLTMHGELTLELARRSRAAGKDAGLLLQDAVTELQRACELDRDDVRAVQLLAAARWESGDPVAATATLARASLRRGEPAALRDPALRAAWVALERTAGDADAAVEVCVRALHESPGDNACATELVDTAYAVYRLPRAIAVLQERGDATSTWHRGRACFLLSDRRADADPAAALALLDDALACFAAAAQRAPDFRDGCDLWRALCLGKKGNLAFAAGDLANAEAWLLLAVRARPDQLETDLGHAQTIKLGLLRVGDRTMRDFARTEALFRAASTAAPWDLDLLNNAAVYARDLGTRLARAGKADEAAAMFERSYAAYVRAVELAPADVRLRNDCALVAIHHLKRDAERSRVLLDAAIADGERELRDAAPSEERARAQLEEAVGDCWENLALWHLQHGDAAAAKAAAERSLGFRPREAREGAAQHLRAAQALLAARAR